MKFFPPVSIRLRLVLLVLLAVLPALAIILYSGLRHHRASIQEAEEEISRLVEVMAERQEDITNGILQTLSALEYVPQVRERDGPGCSRIFKDMIEHCATYLNILAATPSGDVFASGTPARGVSIADRAYFQEAVRTGRFSAGEYIIGRTTAIPTIPFSYPVRDAAGETLAVLAIGMNLDSYRSLLERATLPREANLVLLDRSGVRLFALHPSMNRSIAPGTRIPAYIWQAVAGPAAQGTFLARDHEDRLRMYGYKQLRLRQDMAPYLYLLVGIPEQAVFAKAWGETRRNLVLLAVAAVLALGLAWFVGGHSMVKRVSRLAVVAASLGSGDLKARTGLPEEPDELGLLASTFDTMAQSLESREQERDTALQALALSERRYRLLSENLRDAVFLNSLTPEGLPGNFLEVNETAVQRHGYTREEFLGLSPFDLDILESGNKRIPEVMTRLRNEGHALFETVLATKDGRKIPVENLSHVFPKNGHPLILTVSRDITNRKRIERMREDVERMIRHDLKSPLSGLLSLARVLQLDADLTANQRNCLKAMEDSARDMLDMVGLSLELYRMELGTYRIRPKAVDLLEVAREVMAEVAPQAAATGVSLETVKGGDALDGDLLCLLGERTLLRSMLTNLVRNAVEASPPHCAATVTLASNPQDILIEVRNSGVVPEAIRERFFDKYATTGKGDGLGLGAYSARLFAQAHGGDISMETSQAAGTTVRVRLPRRPGQA